jgi:formate hydrogenlyase subunit 3/multisubunit Na+/H+ antiporter MnhD subunit
MQNMWQMTLMVFAVLTMFVGNLMALLQDDIKRLLAFSTIAQMGYILFGFSMASLQGLTGSFFHIMNHAVMKSLLFLSAGAFVHQVGTRDLRKLEGIRRTMPVTSILLAIGAIAIAAIPPLNGFWSEWMIVLAGVEAEMLPFSALMIVNILISVAYYLRLIYVIVLKEPTSVAEKATEAPFSMLIPILVLAAICIIIGLYPGPFISLAEAAAKAALNL